LKSQLNPTGPGSHHAARTSASIVSIKLILVRENLNRKVFPDPERMHKRGAQDCLRAIEESMKGFLRRAAATTRPDAWPSGPSGCLGQSYQFSAQHLFQSLNAAVVDQAALASNIKLQIRGLSDNQDGRLAASPRVSDF
jgi:hypothetical protein